MRKDRKERSTELEVADSLDPSDLSDEGSEADPAASSDLGARTVDETPVSTLDEQAQFQQWLQEVHRGRANFWKRCTADRSPIRHPDYSCANNWGPFEIGRALEAGLQPSARDRMVDVAWNVLRPSRLLLLPEREFLDVVLKAEEAAAKPPPRRAGGASGAEKWSAMTRLLYLHQSPAIIASDLARTRANRPDVRSTTCSRASVYTWMKECLADVLGTLNEMSASCPR